MSWIANLGLRWKLLGSFGVVLAIMAAQSAFAYRTTIGSQEASRWVDHTYRVIGLAEDTLTDLVNIESGYRGFLVTGQDAFLEPYTAGKQGYAAKLKELQKETADNPAQVARWRDLEARAAAWQEKVTEPGIKLRRDVAAGKATNEQVIAFEASGEGKKHFDGMRAVFADAIEAERALLERRTKENEVASQTLLQVILWGTLLAVGVGLSLAFLVSQSISGAAARVAAAARQIATQDLPAFVRVARALASGDLTQSLSITTQRVTVSGGDELGAMASSFNTMVDQLHEAGAAFGEMTGQLRELIGAVQATAETLASTSDQLGQAAGQTGQAVQQVTQAVQQVAAGSQEASRSAQETNRTIGQLSQAIDAIARGAADQARQVQAASSSADQMAADVEQVASNAGTVASAAQQARAAAQHGAQAVQETVAGMAQIRTVVGQAAARVEELGKIGERIGQVVETIDDIAAQTNLLALNAAIEAARAGEHGKGFAVVADEVRKLAERSQRETKAIAELIQAVQSGTREAVGAMVRGETAIQEGSARADEAGRALGEILQAADSMVTQVTGIAAASQQMARAARQVVEAMQSISAVIEESSAATEEMAAQTGQVVQAAQAIAAVSEENSAAAEEVSASAEEMSAQVEELSAQAAELARTAEELRALVGRFTIGEQARSGFGSPKPALRGDHGPSARGAALRRAA
jgi:methyl-accepting chemotaxis protein